MPRQRRPPKRLHSGSLSHKYQSCLEMYRAIYYEAIDLITTGIRYRFDQPSYQMYANIENLLVRCCTGDSFDEEFRKLTEFYNTDLKPADLHCHLDLLRSIVPKDFDPSTTEIVKLVKDQVSLFNEIRTLLKLLLVLPATSERSFSALKRIKTALRSTMSQARMNSLLLLHVHKEKTDKLLTNQIGNEFLSSNEHRLSIFGNFTYN